MYVDDYENGILAALEHNYVWLEKNERSLTELTLPDTLTVDCSAALASESDYQI